MLKSIAILAPSPVPFQLGGAERACLGLRQAIAALPGCQAELIKLPAPEATFAELVNSYEMFSRIELGHFDMLISQKYPAWMASHPNHVCYMLHCLRGLYDTYHFFRLPPRLERPPAALADLLAHIRKPNPGRADLPQAFELCRRALACKSLSSSLFSLPGPLAREIIHYFDAIALAPGQIRAYFAISATVAAREGYFPPGANAAVLHLPSTIAAFCAKSEDYFFTASRINKTKRLHLLIDAMRWVEAPVKLKIAGTGPELAMLRERATRDPRIEFLDHVPEAGLAELYAHALAVPFVPCDEDYGLITVEAFMSSKPVITTNDAGGALELARHGENALVAKPNARDIARAMNALIADRELARRLGHAGRKSVENINWRDLAAAIAHSASMGRPKVIVASPFMADAHGEGGARRLYHICAALASFCQVELIAMGHKHQEAPLLRQFSPAFRQTGLPWPQAMLACADDLARRTGECADDIAIFRHAAHSPAIVQALADAARGAACAVLCHPWLYPALAAATPDLAVIYEAQDVEADLKTAILGAALGGEARQAEGKLLAAAKAVFTCSQADMRRLGSLYGSLPAYVATLPNGFDASAPMRRISRNRLAYPSAQVALFVASSHRPNVEAVNAIFAMAPELPDVQFLICGTASTHPQIAHAKRPANVHLAGIVSEKVKNILLARADVALNPMLSGSGTNLKTVEYLAFGLDLVSTPFGMRGMPEAIADMAMICPLEKFPAAIAKILASPADADTMARRARAAREQFAWPKTLAGLRPVMEAVFRDMNAPDN